MRKFNHCLPEPLFLALKALSKKTGLSMAELIRRAVEAFLKENKKP